MGARRPRRCRVHVGRAGAARSGGGIGLEVSRPPRGIRETLMHQRTLFATRHSDVQLGMGPPCPPRGIQRRTHAQIGAKVIHAIGTALEETCPYSDARQARTIQARLACAIDKEY